MDALDAGTRRQFAPCRRSATPEGRGPLRSRRARDALTEAMTWSRTCVLGALFAVPPCLCALGADRRRPLEAVPASITSWLIREFLDVGVEGRSRDSLQAANLFHGVLPRPVEIDGVCALTAVHAFASPTFSSSRHENDLGHGIATTLADDVGLTASVHCRDWVMLRLLASSYSPLAGSSLPLFLTVDSLENPAGCSVVQHCAEIGRTAL